MPRGVTAPTAAGVCGAYRYSDVARGQGNMAVRTFFSLFKSTTAKAVIGAVTVGTASLGFISDILGLRSSDEATTTVITVLVNSSDGNIPGQTQQTVAPSTTTTTPDNPESALEALRTSLAARASSGVLNSCSKQAMLLTSSGLRLFEWIEGRGWTDFSELVQPPTNLSPVGMVVVDIPRDGIPDLLVSFERTGTQPPLSGVLGIPNTAIGCGQGYSWQYFNLSDGSFSQLVPNLEPASDGFTSRDVTSGSNLTRYAWSQDRQYFQVQGQATSTPALPGSTADSAVVRQFMTEYGRFSTQSFTAMLQLVEPGSPAEQLVKFLLAGKRAGRDAGYGEGSGFPIESTGEAWRILFPGVATVLSDFVGDSYRIGSFRMNEIEVDKLIRYDDSNPMLSRQCTQSGVCVGIRGVQLGSRTTYVALEIDTSQTTARAKFANSWLTTGSSRQRHLSSTNALVNSPNSSVWSVAYELSELPWGASLEVQLAVNGVTERVTLRIPS